VALDLSLSFGQDISFGSLTDFMRSFEYETWVSTCRGKAPTFSSCKPLAHSTGLEKFENDWMAKSTVGEIEPERFWPSEPPFSSSLGHTSKTTRSAEQRDLFETPGK
jgi:hypothetical protein